MTRAWSIRARTAVAFALASMALSAAVLVFVNLASQSSLRSTSFARVAEPDGSVGIAVSPAARIEVDREHGTLTIASAVAEQQWQWSAVGVLAAGVLAGGVGWVVSRRMLAPIADITATATRISASNLHERIGLDGPDDELRRLSGTIDALLGRLEAAFDSQRHFVAQASHELRTPLAVQRAVLQIGLPDDAGPAEVAAARDQLLAHNRQTEHLVESLLTLAEADRGLVAAREPIDLVALAHEVAASSGGTRDDVTCGVTVIGDGPCGVTGEPVLVRQLLTNLVDNAVEYNEPGGTVTVRVDAAGLTVENTGAVVPDEVAATLVEPFRRHADGTASGTRRHSGLGLSIVAAIARAHGWSLALASRSGGGLRVRIGVSPV